MKVWYFNALPHALRHYSLEFEETMQRIMMRNERVLDAPSAEGVTRLQQLSYIIQQLIKSRRHHSPDLSIHFWPSTGLFELLLSGGSRNRSILIYHDPIPLRKQFGFGRLTKALTSRLPFPNKFVLTHSRDAATAMDKLAPRAASVFALHPLRSVQTHYPIKRKLILVAGQFKEARNLDVLRQLGPALRAKGFDTKILGRGWPEQIDGWDVDSRFVTEEELEEALASAMAVLLPYHHYFQSGILIRALEMGTLTVTPRTSFAEDVYGAESDLIVADPTSINSWASALDAAVSNTISVQDTFNLYRNRVDSSWRDLFALYKP